MSHPPEERTTCTRPRTVSHLFILCTTRRCRRLRLELPHSPITLSFSHTACHPAYEYERVGPPDRPDNDETPSRRQRHSRLPGLPGLLLAWLCRTHSGLGLECENNGTSRIRRLPTAPTCLPNTVTFGGRLIFRFPFSLFVEGKHALHSTGRVSYWSNLGSTLRRLLVMPSAGSTGFQYRLPFDFGILLTWS
ncbi:hypothetical protein EV126DRAFT_15197 [Verticillium dahliae]|nr:hypothetical protein EV126DRAFT_15197 [Verticillium dahliae]